MDTRKARSRQAIEDAFLALLLECDYTKITVADILERSGVGRATFYAQFKGKDDLLAVFVGSVCAHALTKDGNLESDPAVQVEHVLRNLWERHDGVRALVSGAGSRRFADCLRHAIVARAAQVVPEHPSGPAGQMNRSFLLHHIAAAFVGMVQWWAWNDFSVAPSDLAADYLRAILPLFSPQQ